MLGLSARRMSGTGLGSHDMAHSMLDCPEHTQTSPTRMSLTTIAGLLAPRTVISSGPFAASALSGSKTTRHVPSARGHGLLLLAVEQDRDRLALAGPSPDRDGLVLLDDHVVADDRGQLDLCGEAAGPAGREDERQR